MNNTETQQQNISHNTLSMRESVLSRITDDGIAPKSRWLFRCSTYLVWIVWAVTIIVGSIAFAEAIYVAVHSGVEFFEMTHDSLALFVLDSLPYIWLVAFITMLIFAQYNMRHTPRGYRYPLWQIIGSSLVFTILGGVVLHAAGVSATIDRMVSHMPGYLSVEERQMYLWEHPHNGRLIGTFTAFVDDTDMVFFEDTRKRNWVVRIHELPRLDRETLLTGDRVRLLGEASMGAEQDSFYACAVMPWMPKEGYTISTLQNARANAKARIERFIEREIEVTSEPSMRCREIMRSVLLEARANES